MAVIREKRQFRVGPIGIARASRGGQIVGEAIAESANQLSRRFFQRAAEEAREKGIESVAELTDAEVLTIGEDGKPEAFKAPLHFGRIATKAREQALLTRFQEELEIELTDKAQELSNKYRKNPEAFKKAMSDYTASMANAEESTIFTQTIENAGAAITSSIHRRLQLASMQRHEAEMKKHNKYANSQAYLTYESLIAAGQIEAANQVLDGINQRNQNDLNAGYIQSSDLLLNNVRQRTALLNGTLTRILKTYGQELSPAQLTKLQIAINNGDASYLPKHFSGPTGSDDIFKIFSKELEKTLQDSKNGTLVLNGLKEFAAPIIKSSQDRVLFDTALATQQNLIQARDEDLADLEATALNDVANIDEDIANVVKNFKIAASQAEAAATGFYSEEYVESITAGAERAALTLGKSLQARIISEAKDTEDLALIQQYLLDGNSDAVNIKNESLSLLLKEYTTLAKGIPSLNFNASLSDLATSFKDEKSLFDRKNEIENYYDIQSSIQNTISSDLLDMSDRFDIGPTLSEDYSSIIKQIESKNLDPAEAKSLKNLLDIKLGRAYLTDTLKNVVTSGQLLALDTYMKTGIERNEGELTETQKKNIDKARKLMGQQSLNAVSNPQIQSIEANLANEAELAEVKATLTKASLGIAENTKEEREKLDAPIDAAAKEAGYESASDFYLTYADENIDAEKEQELIQQLRVFNIPPQEFITLAEQFAKGGFAQPNASALKFLTIYEALDTKLNLRTGNSFDSPALSQALNADDKAMLDALLATKKTLPFDMTVEQKEAALFEKMVSVRAVMNDPALKKNLNVTLGDDEKAINPDQWVITNFPEIGIDKDMRDIAVASITINFAESLADPEKAFDPEGVVKKIMDSRYKEDNIVRDYGPSSPKTAYPLELTTGGDRDLFLGYVRSELRDNVIGGDKINWEDEEFYLIPVGEDTVNKGQTYVVVDKNNVTYKRNIPDGEGGQLEIAVFISTREMDFVDIQTTRREKLKSREITKAQKQQLRDRILEKYPSGSNERKKATDKLASAVYNAVVIASAETNLNEAINEDDLEYLKNGVFNNEAVLMNTLNNINDSINDFVNQDPKAYGKNYWILLVQQGIKNSIGFIGNEYMPRFD